MNEYPKMLYKYPGSEEMHGGRFATLIVQDADEQDAAVADGWALTTTEAKNPAPPPEPIPESSAPETEEERSRDLLKAEAIKLGLQFPKNIPTDRLVEIIAEAKAGA